MAHQSWGEPHVTAPVFQSRSPMNAPVARGSETHFVHALESWLLDHNGL